MKKENLVNYILTYILLLAGPLASGKECYYKDSNDLLNNIKNNHPVIKVNALKTSAIKAGIAASAMRINPELDIEGGVGEVSDENILKSSISIKHTIEMAGKREKRVNVATYKYKKEKSIYEGENNQKIIESVINLHRLRQIYELIPIYEEAKEAFTKILSSLKSRNSLSPEQQVERETLELAVSDYELKISQLKAQREDIIEHIQVFTGSDCTISLNALPKEVNLSEKYDSGTQVENLSDLEVAKNNLNLKNALYELEAANSIPNLKIGPSFEYEKNQGEKEYTVGISLSMDLPILRSYTDIKYRAKSEFYAAKSYLKSVEIESSIDLKAWVQKYNRYKKSLKTIANKERLEKKHKKIESLFSRGIISTALVIESHRQLIEFFNTRFEFEIGATEALWNIYKYKNLVMDKGI